MFERSTDRARKALQLANTTALENGHEYVATPHIVVGIFREGSGVAANVLRNLNVNMVKLSGDIQAAMPSGRSSSVLSGKLPHTENATQAIKQAIVEARNLNHNYVGTEHLLLGVLAVDEFAR